MGPKKTKNPPASSGGGRNFLTLSQYPRRSAYHARRHTCATPTAAAHRVQLMTIAHGKNRIHESHPFFKRCKNESRSELTRSPALIRKIHLANCFGKLFTSAAE